MTAAVAPTAAPSSALRSALATKPLWLVGVAATVVAAVAAALVAAVAKAADVPLEVGSGGEAPEVIPTAGFAVMALAAGAIGVVLALALNRWARRPARTFVVVTVLLTAVSLLSPTSLVAETATTATRLVLELAHVVAAAIVIPAIAYGLSRRPARS